MDQTADARVPDESGEDELAKIDEEVVDDALEDAGLPDLPEGTPSDDPAALP